jgi:dolichol-phosphate mannosyltransferase
VPVVKQPPILSLVIPVRNEAENVGPLISEIRTALEGALRYEIIYVDDGSHDETPRMLAAAHFPELRVIRHRKPCGQSTAIHTGVRAARAAWVATLDGDGQNDPADIWTLLAARDSAPEGPLLVAGHRRRRMDSRLRRLSSSVANRIRGRLLGDRTPDTGCGLKLFPTAVFLELPYFDHMHRFLPALFLRAGARVISVEVRHRPRLRGRSNYGLFDRLWVGIVDLFGVMWLQARVQHPIVEEQYHELECRVADRGIHRSASVHPEIPGAMDRE